MIEMILLLVVLVAVLGYTLWPLLGESAPPSEAAVPTGAGSVAREAIEEALADLEYDRKSGRITHDDYHQLRHELLAGLGKLPPEGRA
jgi:hypothetical protein